MKLTNHARAYLESLYRLTNGSLTNSAYHETVVARAGLTPQAGFEAFRCLLENRLIESGASMGEVTLTAYGLGKCQTTVIGPSVLVLPGRTRIRESTIRCEVREIVVETHSNCCNTENSLMTPGETVNDNSAREGPSQPYDELGSEIPLWRVVFRGIKRVLTSFCLERGLRYIITKLRRLL